MMNTLEWARLFLTIARLNQIGVQDALFTYDGEGARS